MTIKELKEILAKYPDDILVEVYDGGNGDSFTIWHHWLNDTKWIDDGGIKRIETLILSIDG